MADEDRPGGSIGVRPPGFFVPFFMTEALAYVGRAEFGGRSVEFIRLD
jgi:hypothetical protein